ncbi:SubName: Full=Uncharacterized protein {ECO:0000313/EMBL:CCA71531.1} [Serendipita indica DSM 11827]|nr:SubName: Full=Uncharacterized protein {ECO:0000313/EMBL:CCA71531.1} [Serendipita indica DSM 11827]
MYLSDSNLTSRTTTHTHSFKPQPPLNSLVSSIGSSHEQVYESGSSRQQSDISRATSAVGHLQTQTRAQVHAPTKGRSRRNTQQLISIFEQATSEAAIMSQPLQRGLPLPPSPSARNAPAGPRVTKRAPLRDSFRNLVSAFNKAKRSFGDSTPARVRPPQMDTVGKVNDKPASTTGNSSCVAVPPEVSLSKFTPSFPPDVRSGILLYYDDNPRGAVWHRCNAFLSSSTLRISYFNTSGKESTRSFRMNHASDARSMTDRSSFQVGPPLLDSHIPCAFEVNFGEKGVEIFAAISALERVGWISAIWDSIISGKCADTEHAVESSRVELALSLPISDRDDNEAVIHSPRPVDATSQDISPLLLLKRTGSPSCSRSTWVTEGSAQSHDHTISQSRTGTALSVRERIAHLNQMDRNSSQDLYATPPRTPSIASRKSTAQTSPLRKTVALRYHVDSPRSAQVKPLVLSSHSSIRKQPTMTTNDNAPSSNSSTSSQGLLHIHSVASSPLSNIPPKESTQSPDMTMRNIDTMPNQDFVHPGEIARMHKILSSIQKDVKLAIQQPPLPIPQLDDLRNRLQALASGLHSADLHGLHTKLETLQPTQVDEFEGKVTLNLAEEIEELRLAIEAMKIAQEDKLAGLPQILESLEALRESQNNAIPPPVPAKDVSPSETSPQEDLLMSLKEQVAMLNNHFVLFKEETEKVNIAFKLEESVPLRSLSVFSKRSQGPVKDVPESQPTGPGSEIQEILRIVKAEQEQQLATGNQFEDSIRYLNELNKWMEAFVAKTSDHEQLLHKISGTLEKVVSNNQASALRAIGSDATEGSSQEPMTGLKASVDTFLSKLNELQGSGGLLPIMAMIKQNRSEQDELLRLSSDIKGDRLRFVEAMKEATTVNVAMQIDEFKRQLSHEVSAMLQDVGKFARARERKHLEQEIQEIFNKQVEHQSMRTSQPVMMPSLPSRPASTSQGPYPVFMLPPGAPTVHGSAVMHPPPFRPNSGFMTRALPTPAPYAPTPQPQTHVEPPSPTRRLA